YSISQEAGDVAIVVKLMRVAMLLPVILFAATFTRLRGNAPGSARPPLLPGFAVAFVAFVGLNSTGWLPSAAVALGNDLSRWCLVAAVAALGTKTRLGELVAVGFKPVALMVGETVFLALLALALLHLLF